LAREDARHERRLARLTARGEGRIEATAMSQGMNEMEGGGQ